MPNRPDSHRLEARSLKAFQDAVPDAWAVDTPSQGADYGIDATVELFDADDEAEGLGFAVQVEGTRQADLGAALGLPFRVATLDYYAKLERPVLLVRYHAPTEALYAGWCHRLDDGRREPGRETKTLRWTDADVWTNATAAALARDVRRYRAARRPAAVRPVAVDVVLREGGALTPERARRLRRVLRTFPDEHVAFATVPGAGDAVACVVIDGGWAEVDYGGVAGTRADLPGRLDAREEVQAFARTLACLVGVCAGCAGHATVGASVVAAHIEGASIWASPGFAPAAVLVLVDGGRRELALGYLHHLYDVAGEEELTDPEWRGLLWSADSAASALRTRGMDQRALGVVAEHEVAEVGALLERAVAVRATRGGGPALGGALYTLANHLYNDDGSPEATRAAVGYYNLARKHEPDYCGRAYFASGLGAALFGVSKYRAAAAWYARAIELGQDDDETTACWGDALMLCGRFAEAEAALSAWADALERPFWWLKWRTAGWLRDRWGDRVERRRSAAADLGWREGAGAQEHLETAVARLTLDPLDVGAAFNAGVSFADTGRWDEAADHFVLCAMLYPPDVEVWRNALLAALNAGPDRLALALSVGRAAVRSGGRAFFEAVEDAVDEHPDSAARDVVDEVLTLLRETAPTRVPTFTMRVYPTEDA